MRISDWSSDVCSSDLEAITFAAVAPMTPVRAGDVVGTVKIIPYAVPRAELVSAGPAADVFKVRIAAFGPPSVNLVQDRKSVVSGKRVSDSVYRRGSRILQQKTNKSYS